MLLFHYVKLRSYYSSLKLGSALSPPVQLPLPHQLHHWNERNVRYIFINMSTRHTHTQILFIMFNSVIWFWCQKNRNGFKYWWPQLRPKWHIGLVDVVENPYMENNWAVMQQQCLYMVHWGFERKMSDNHNIFC